MNATYATNPARMRGRLYPEAESAFRTPFQRDRDRIIHASAFRRLKHKTQVFIESESDYYRTRLTHSLEVSQISRSICRLLKLNEDLGETVALAHDLGHPPFGHGGEMALKEIYSPDFSHHKQSLRIVDVLEMNGKGLNLTYEVRDGILKHSKGYGKIIPDDPDEMACTVEGNIVRIADIMAYLNHDLDDAVKSGVIKTGQIPDTCIKVLGHTHSERATVMIKDLISSAGVQDGQLRLSMNDEVYAAMAELRQFLYDNVYRSPQVHQEFVKAKRVLSELYVYFFNNESMLQKELAVLEMSACNHSGLSKERIVCDFIASLTDRYALDLYTKIFFPTPQV